jgi:glycosyltransferase A (GT-A) superfamily protein (DUF2064 family)
MSQHPWTTAVAIFAKTPGLTPAKTRLAAGVGPAIAESFYLRALEITREVACAAATADPGLTPYWAVAEQAGIGRECWSGLPQLWQGDGDLGARLAQVYDSLLVRHDAVLLIGSDSPLLVPGHLLQAHAVLQELDRAFVVGRALDGGFYLCGGKLPLPRTVWTTVSYSGADTANQLLANLEPVGSVGLLEPLPDVDTLEDLLGIPALAAASSDLLPAQRALVEWIRTLALR